MISLGDKVTSAANGSGATTSQMLRAIVTSFLPPVGLKPTENTQSQSDRKCVCVHAWMHVCICVHVRYIYVSALPLMRTLENSGAWPETVAGFCTPDTPPITLSTAASSTWNRHIYPKGPSGSKRKRGRQASRPPSRRKGWWIDQKWSIS